ncbi:glycosyl transferase [Microbacterium nanhaiense]|uniref:Glycosyl transferase n=1 Tax=Microbacterium nanhaiense TaxID=1301026 RepID=A0ABQ2N4F4_9MICO|nr:glycosyltransferase family 9 protein [Microbacterium nanhaiense]GGO66810.1 glycosyl transferase [Microbacterium nanhaiense]
MSRRVLVARLDSAGDVLVCGPAVRAIARDSEVVMLVGPRGRAAAELLPGVAELIVWDAPWIANPAPPATPVHMSDLVERVRAAGVDEAVILTSFHQSPLPLALALRLAGVGRITGVSTDYAGSLLDVRLRPGEDLPEDIPEPLRALAIAEAAGWPSEDSRLAVSDLRVPPGLPPRGGYVVLHPGASVPARQAPVELFAAAARILASRCWEIVVTGSADERGLAARIPASLDLSGSLDLASLAGAIEGAAAIVVGNTGPAHLAAAVGTPVVSLFSPVVPVARWAPHGVPVRILGDQDAACRGTRARECPVPGHPCLSTIAPEELADAVEALAREEVPA